MIVELSVYKTNERNVILNIGCVLLHIYSFLVSLKYFMSSNYAYYYKQLSGYMSNHCNSFHFNNSGYRRLHHILLVGIRNQYQKGIIIMY